jgi:hypothetical protein
MFWLMIAQSVTEVPGPDVDPTQMGQRLIESIDSRNWGLAVGVGIMLIVWVLRLLWPKLSKKALPWIAVAIGAFGAFGLAMISAPTEWLQAVLAGIAAGLSAAGTWGLLGFVRKK